MDNIQIQRPQGIIVVPRDIHQAIVAEGAFYSIQTIERTYGKYCRVMVAKKHKGSYVYRKYLGRIVLSPPDDLMIDHIDGNPLNNCVSNLRTVDHSTNGMNRKKARNTKFKYKGVSYSKKDKAFRAQIKSAGKSKSLGYHETEKDAALAYDKAALELFGEFACLNFPDAIAQKSIG